MAGNTARTESHETLVTSARKLAFNWPLKFGSEAKLPAHGPN